MLSRNYGGGEWQSTAAEEGTKKKKEGRKEENKAKTLSTRHGKHGKIGDNPRELGLVGTISVWLHGTVSLYADVQSRGASTDEILGFDFHKLVDIHTIRDKRHREGDSPALRGVGVDFIPSGLSTKPCIFSVPPSSLRSYDCSMSPKPCP